MLWILLIFLLFFIQIAFVLINEYCRPQKAIAWLTILYLFPLVGFLLYFFMAKEYSCFSSIHRKNKNPMLDQIKEELMDRCNRRLETDPFEPIAQQYVHSCAMQKNGTSLPITSRNETAVYIEGEQAFEAMFEAISAAKHHIHVEFYIIHEDDIGRRLQQLLIRKAQEGIKVRLLYDGFGCRRLSKSFLSRLQKAGVETGCFFPPLSTFIDKRINYRNHRKIVVVDGCVGFIGGMNIGDEYLGKNPKIGHWRDTQFRIKGDAVLWIQYTFLSDWYMVSGKLHSGMEYYPFQDNKGEEFVQIIKSGPDETILELIFSLIVSAKKRIYIETPYFVPDPGIILALKTASRRGVDIRIIIPAVPDSKLVYCASLSFVRELQQAGIRFFRYQKGFIHAKVILCDDIACSGSTNMDMRSFTGQFEIDAIFFDGKVLNRLVEEFNRDLGGSKEIVPEEFEKRPIFQKMMEVLARLLSPLF